MLAFRQRIHTAALGKYSCLLPASKEDKAAPVEAATYRVHQVTKAKKVNGRAQPSSAPGPSSQCKSGASLLFKKRLLTLDDSAEKVYLRRLRPRFAGWLDGFISA